MKRLSKSLAVGLLTVSMALASTAEACTNFLVTKGASKDGSTFITYAADSHTLYGELYYRRAASFPKGTMFTVIDWDSGRPLGQIEQVEHTYSVVGNMNEHQLAISETTYGGRPELEGQGVIDYGSLIYITLQRAKNAREAIKVMSELIERYGYASSGESFSIADPNEVWVMDLIGKGKPEYDTIKGKAKIKKAYKNWNPGAVWVAMRVPDGYVCGHANHARITAFPMEKDSKNSISSKNMARIFEPNVDVVYAYDVIDFAKLKGIYTERDGKFSFSDTYAPLDFSAARGCEARVYAFFNRVNSNMKQYEKYAMGHDFTTRMPLWIKPDKKLGLEDVMAMMRDHYEGTSMDMTQDLGAGPYQCPYRWRPMGWSVDGVNYVHERATSTQQTGFSFVAQCRSWLPNIIGGILWFGVDDTYSTVYAPMYCGINKIPLCFREGNGNMVEYSETSAFWLFNRVTNFAYSRYNDMIKDIIKVQNRLESGFIKDVASFDKVAEKELASTKDTAAVIAMLTNFSDAQAELMFNEWKKLDNYLMVKYIDGNIKKEKDGKFLESEYRDGQCVFPEQPSYPEWWYRAIIKDHGETIKVVK